jgi:hypothetical protein
MCYSYSQTPPSPVASAVIALIYRADRSISSSLVSVFCHLSHLSNHSALIRTKDRGKCSHIIGSYRTCGMFLGCSSYELTFVKLCTISLQFLPSDVISFCVRLGWAGLEWVGLRYIWPESITTSVERKH